MTIELARRLFHGGVVATEDLEAALFDSVRRGVPFPQALAQRSSMGAELIDRELERVTGAGLGTVVVDPDLLGMLPDGLCEKLLAVPLDRDPTTDEVTVAAVDPLDPHVAEEFGYHLGTPVVVLAAPRRIVASALSTPSEPSDPPPRTLAYAEVPQRRAGARACAPQESTATGQIPVISERNRASESEPPIPLVRRSVIPSSDAKAPTRSSSVTAPSLEAVLEGLEWAGRPDEVVDQLVEGLEAFALRVAVFAEQGDVHRGRAASRSLGGAAAARTVVQPGSSACVLDRAVAQGRYLGPLAPADANSAIAELLGDFAEVYAAPVVVLGRPALVLLLGSLQATALATRRADDLAKAGAVALERILKARKGR